MPCSAPTTVRARRARCCRCCTALPHSQRCRRAGAAAGRTGRAVRCAGARGDARPAPRSAPARRWSASWCARIAPPGWCSPPVSDSQRANVVSSADPKTTFLQLLGSEHLDAGFVRRVAHLRARGLTAKLHLALDRLPQFTGLDAAALRGRLLVAPSRTTSSAPTITPSTTSTRRRRCSKSRCRRWPIQRSRRRQARAVGRRAVRTLRARGGWEGQRRQRFTERRHRYAGALTRRQLRDCIGGASC